MKDNKVFGCFQRLYNNDFGTIRVSLEDRGRWDAHILQCSMLCPNGGR